MQSPNRHCGAHCDAAVCAGCGEIKSPPFDKGKALAAGILAARFVSLQGQNHLFLENEPAAQWIFEEVKLFLGH